MWYVEVSKISARSVKMYLSDDGLFEEKVLFHNYNDALEVKHQWGYFDVHHNKFCDPKIKVVLGEEQRRRIHYIYKLKGRFSNNTRKDNDILEYMRLLWKYQEDNRESYFLSNGIIEKVDNIIKGTYNIYEMNRPLLCDVRNTINDELASDIKALEEDLLEFEKKYGIKSKVIYNDYMQGIEPDDDNFVLDYGEWAGTYGLYLEFIEKARLELTQK